MVSAMSERLSRVKPARYMTPKVPIRDTGTATSGTMAARALRRNMNTDSTTSATEIASARSTSWSDARIVGVRSMYTLREMLAGMVARRCGSSARTRSTVAMMLAPGWRNRISMTAGSPLASPSLRRSCTESLTWAMSPRRTAAPLW